LLVVAFIGIIVYIVCLRPLKGSLEGTLLVSLIVALFFEEVIQLAFGPKPQAIPPFMTGRFLLGGVSVPSQRILVLIVSVATLSSLWIFISKTKVGGAILAVSQDPEAASLVGIHTNRIILIVNGLAAFLAALAGMLVSPLLSSTPIMWILPFVKAFVIVILGGLGSIAGSIIAAVIVGYTETIVSFALSPRFTELITLGFLFLVIVVRPSGIMGTKMQR
jgi:branched-chain amino acid transport system permease protein